MRPGELAGCAVLVMSGGLLWILTGAVALLFGLTTLAAVIFLALAIVAVLLTLWLLATVEGDES